MYRFEIEKSEFVPYTYSVDVESFTELGMVYAKIKLGNQGQYLHMFNNHLQSSSNFKDHEVLLSTLECRKDQLVELANFVEDKTNAVINDPDHLVLICGDFNINPLKESDESVELILSYGELNHKFIK